MPDIVKNARYGKVSRIYCIWVNMRQRCANNKTKSYRHYGRRGIEVCSEWKDFDAFLSWANDNGYRDDLQIDRIDNNGSYSPENCRWVTPTENMRNRSITKLSGELVDEIRRRYVPRCKNNGARAMAREFSLHHDTVEKVIRGQLWI